MAVTSSFRRRTRFRLASECFARRGRDDPARCGLRRARFNEKRIMPKLNVHDVKGKKVGTYNIEVTDLAPRINKQLLHDAVVMYQSNLRQGSHKTKNRHEV